MTSTLLRELFPELDLPVELASVVITGVAIDSRTVSQGDLFVALKGAKADGKAFIANAVQLGASAIAIEASTDCKAGQIRFVDKVPVLAVANLAKRVSALAGQCYGDPSTHMKVIGVTGTNGKSTCVSVIAQLFRATEGRSAAMGTLGVETANQRYLDGPSMTTPDAAACQRILSRLCWDEKIDLLAMEVSSHGLDQYRVAGIRFHVGLFTNISQDHLDYHGTIENYAAAKQKLFESMGLQAAVINLDDPHAGQMVGAAKQNTKVLTYSLLHFAADFYASDIHYHAQGVRFTLTCPEGAFEISSPLLGEFNVYNLIASMAALNASGVSLNVLVEAVPSLKAVPGRMQQLTLPSSDITVVVDYAHTPDALKHAIAATRAHTAGSLWVVFGCGGDRDRTKRAVMGEIAERFADRCVVTSDNPRSEDPQQIIQDITRGFKSALPDGIVDREQAIAHALRQAAPGDVVIIAGKGHETTQIIGERSVPFDDVAVAEKYLSERLSQAGRLRS